MALISLKLNPSKKELQSFGDITLFMCNIIGLLLMWMANMPLRGFLFFCFVGMTIYLLSRISTKLVRPIYVGLIVVTFPIGWIVSHTMMALFYYVIIGGIGLLFKLIKRNPLGIGYDRQVNSYWIPYEHNRAAKDYFRQF